MKKKMMSNYRLHKPRSLFDEVVYMPVGPNHMGKLAVPWPWLAVAKKLSYLEKRKQAAAGRIL